MKERTEDDGINTETWNEEYRGRRCAFSSKFNQSERSDEWTWDDGLLIKMSPSSYRKIRGHFAGKVFDDDSFGT